jgi:arylformamidase
MRYFDLTLPLSSKLPAWPGDQPFQRRENRGSGIVSRLVLSSHTGTHIDAPRHFLFNKSGIDKIALRALVGQFQVIGISSSPLITVEELKSKLKNLQAGARILLKTKNGKKILSSKFSNDWISLSLSGAKFLATKKVALVGIDYFGIEPKNAPGNPVHKALLNKKIVIVEALNLSAVRPGIYQGAILPLNIVNGDGAPARAVLWK